MKKETLSITTMDWGLIDYADALNRQMDLAYSVCNTKNIYLIFCSHPVVVTIGKNPSEVMFKVEERVLKKFGIDVIRVSRGGSITAHFPGQVVMYVVMSIKSFGFGIKEYMEFLEAVVSDAIYEVTDIRLVSKNRGLWYQDGKVASFGVGIKRWCTYHGCAININVPDIINELVFPCGEDGVFRGLSEITKQPIIDEGLKSSLVRNFVKKMTEEKISLST